MKRPPKIARPKATPFVADLRPRHAVDDELDWFFNRAECDMGNQSNYLAMLGRAGPGSAIPSPEAAVEAAHRARLVHRWLKAMDPADAGVLQCAYELRPWPIALYDALGRLTGVYVRLACALDSWPDDRASQQVVEMARAEWLAASGEIRPGGGAFVTLRREAEVRFVRAHHAYGVVRGGVRGSS